MPRLALFLLALPLALVLTACNPAVLLGLVPIDAEIAERSSAELEITPPPIVLRTDDGREQQGGSGSYCWFAANQGVCADMIGSGVPETPLRVAPNASLIFDLGALDTKPAAEFGCAVYRYDDVVETLPDGGGPLIMHPLEPGDVAVSTAICPQAPIENVTTIQREVDLTPGHYAIEVFARAEAGSTSQGFNLIVE